MRALKRRDFLAAMARAGAGSWALSALPGWMLAAPPRTASPPGRPPAPTLSRPAPAPPTGPEIIERCDWPEHWETSLEALGRSWITPNHRFFVRSHFPAPRIVAADWRLEVLGQVRTPLQLSLEQLRALPGTEAVFTLECAGNGRALYPLPNTSGTQWEYGAVGNATWSGVKLSVLLDRAGVQPDARHVWFEAADRATLPDVPPFMRSIPIEKAMQDTILAYSMNGQPLPLLHGAPLRAIVPGWYGMASTKWLTRIRVESAPSDNHFMVKGYRYVYPGDDPAHAAPVEEMRVKSIMFRPTDGARVTLSKPAPAGEKPRPPDRLRIQGFAWAGTSGVRLVEISTDGGANWRPAGFMGDTARLAWRMWATEVELTKPGRIEVLARATNGAGETQPFEAKPNASGYGNNSIQRVKVDVVA